MKSLSEFGHPFNRASLQRPSDVVFISDYLEDVDDILAAIGAMGLSHLSLLNIGGVCVGTDPTDIRSQAGRGLWDRIGGASVPLACGRGRHDEFWNYTCPWTRKAEFLPAKTFLAERFLRAEERSLTVVVMAPVTDLAEFIMEHKALFERATKRVVIMGEVEFESGAPKLVDGLMVPGSAKNLFFNKSAGDYVVRTVQELGIPMTFVTRHAAMAASISMSTWDEMGSRGGEIGTWLAKGVRHHMNCFWYNCNLQPGHPIRIERQMPDRQNRDWFIDIILGKNEEAAGRCQTDKIDDLVKSIPVYDLLAVLAASDELVFKFFEPIRVLVRDQEHLIIGPTKNNHGVKDPAKLVAFMTELVFATFEEAAFVHRFTGVSRLHETFPGRPGIDMTTFQPSAPSYALPVETVAH